MGQVYLIMYPVHHCTFGMEMSEAVLRHGHEDEGMSESFTVEQWEEERTRLNDLVLGNGNLNVRRFFALDHQAYVDGALNARTKEMIGLVASLVLRCDD